MDIFQEYFSDCTEQRIKEHYVIVYEVSQSDYRKNSVQFMLAGCNDLYNHIIGRIKIKFVLYRSVQFYRHVEVHTLYVPLLFIFLSLSNLLPTTLSHSQLLEEMLDNGFPLATESNVLRELIKPPSIVRNVVNTLTGETK